MPMVDWRIRVPEGSPKRHRCSARSDGSEIHLQGVSRLAAAAGRSMPRLWKGGRLRPEDRASGTGVDPRHHCDRRGHCFGHLLGARCRVRSDKPVEGVPRPFLHLPKGFQCRYVICLPRRAVAANSPLPGSELGSDEAKRKMSCPRCGGSIYRIRRRFVDRVISLFTAVRRYRCTDCDCRWEGNLRPERLARRPGPDHVRTSS